MPTPLDNIPQIPFYMEPYFNQFKDIQFYKTESGIPFSLHDYESYMRVNNIQIHPYLIWMLISLDRAYMNEYNSSN